jgi:ubiquinone/menaquinone biosynthesis C-methylase UbiE
VDPLGHFVPINYSSVTTPQWNIPDSSADLVTMNQGLHHLPQGEIMKFLAEVCRVLRPGGLFIIREHDAKPANEVKVSLYCNILFGSILFILFRTRVMLN